MGRQDSLGIGPVPSASPRTSRGIQSVEGGEWWKFTGSPDRVSWGTLQETPETPCFLLEKKAQLGDFCNSCLKNIVQSHSQQYSCSEQHDQVQVVRCWNSNEVDRLQLPFPCHILWSTGIYGQRLCSCNWQCFSMTSWHMLTCHALKIFRPLPSGKPLPNYGKSPCYQWVNQHKSTNSMAIFNSFFYVYQAG